MINLRQSGQVYGKKGFEEKQITWHCGILYNLANAVVNLVDD
jgi:hypothetical protein